MGQSGIERKDEVSGSAEGREVKEKMDPAVKVGYWLAVVFPMVGLLVGTALISRSPVDDASRKGPRIVVLSLISFIVWILLIATLDELFGGLLDEIRSE